MKRELSGEAKKALEVLVQERQSNPQTRLSGIPRRVLGARIGAYLNNPIYIVAELRDRGYVREIKNNIIITEEGCSYIRPWYRKAIQLPKSHTILTIIAILVTIIAIVVTIIFR